MIIKRELYLDELIAKLKIVKVVDHNGYMEVFSDSGEERGVKYVYVPFDEDIVLLPGKIVEVNMIGCTESVDVIKGENEKIKRIYLDNRNNTVIQGIYFDDISNNETDVFDDESVADICVDSIHKIAVTYGKRLFNPFLKRGDWIRVVLETEPEIYFKNDVKMDHLSALVEVGFGVKKNN